MAGVYGHVIFDLDGTLVDSRIDLAQAVNHMLRHERLPALAPETITTFIGAGVGVLVQRALGEHQERFESSLAEFLRYYRAHLLDNTRPYPGIPELLADLRGRDIGLSVLSNKPAEFGHAIIDGLGWLPFVSVLVGGDSLPQRKPDPAGVSHIAAQTGIVSERILLVGDSPIDFETARRAGVAFCGVGWGLAPDHLRRLGVRRLIAQPSELLAVVDSPEYAGQSCIKR